MALFYILVTFFNVCLIKDLSSYLFLHSICCNMLFHLKYKKNPASQRSIFEKGRRITTFQITVDILSCYYTETQQAVVS